MTPERILLPGLVDIHVHMRDPGQTDKEDFHTGTSAALAGGFTAVFDMPNNVVPVTGVEVLARKEAEARGKIVCNVGLYAGSLGDDLDELPRLARRTWGLKLYLNRTTGGFLLDVDRVARLVEAWPGPGPVLVHAESDVIDTVLAASAATGRRIHVCHVSGEAELEPVLRAKDAGIPVTCGVTPHHLFLTREDADRLGPFGEVRPCLRPRADQDFLWKHLDRIDVIESDHAPHTRADKEAGAFGYPGLETTLPLLLQAEREGRLTRDDVIDKCASGPRRLLGLPEEPDTVVEVDPVEIVLGSSPLHSRSGWTPFTGRPGFGRVRTVTIRGTLVFDASAPFEDQVRARPGEGHLLIPVSSSSSTSSISSTGIGGDRKVP